MICLTKHAPVVCLLMLLAVSAYAQVPVRGTVTDPSGAVVPGASVTLHGATGSQRTLTGAAGEYSFANVAPGKYTLRVAARGFVESVRELDVSAPLNADLELAIAAEADVVNVEGDTGAVTTEAGSNASALVLGKKELEALSDDPDELQQQLQAMAGPGAGPNGGQIFIDGFSGGAMPSKGSILQVKINSNPYAPEFDRPGFGRIEIITRPGADKLHGQAFVQYNSDVLNARNPLLRSPRCRPTNRTSSA